MADLSCDILVIGAGALGLSVAAELRSRGRRVRVVDAGGANASSIAAGMIAPALESLLDGADADRAALLRRAGALWPSFAARHGVTLDPTPAEWRGPDPDGVASRLSELGFRVRRTAEGVAAIDDIRVDAVAALARLAATVDITEATVGALGRQGGGWRVALEGATGVATIFADRVVLATGTAAAPAGLPGPVARAMAGIRPIAGQIGRVEARLTDRVLRGPDGYVVPVEGGTLIGATMVEGPGPARVDDAASARLIAAAERLTGRRVKGPVTWRAASRGATPDGLPLAGAAGEGLALALGPRRNGWLMAPLVARVVADGIEGCAPMPDAKALDPLRFGTA